MNVENSFSIIFFTTSAIMLFTWWWQTKRPPQYREDFKILLKSKRAGKSAEHFKCYLIYSGKLYFKFSILLFGLGLVGLIINFNNMIGAIMSITVIMIVILFIAIKTENALIKKFGK